MDRRPDRRGLRCGRCLGPGDSSKNAWWAGLTTKRSNPPTMHFSRNPPGPNTSRIEGLSGPVAGPSVAPSRAIPLAPRSSPTGIYSRFSAVAEFLFLFSIESVAELDARFTRVLSSALARAIQQIDNNSTSVWSPSAARIIKAFTQPACCIKHLDVEQSSLLLTTTKND